MQLRDGDILLSRVCETETRMLLLSRVCETETRMLSTSHGSDGTKAARIRLDIVYTGRWEGAKPCWFQASSLYQSELGQHGTAWHGTLLARFDHVYTATAKRAEPSRSGTVLARFQVAV